MATKRMVSLKIVDSDAFMDMPQTTQLLYFHLCMRTDDDGFVGNPKKIMRMIGSAENDLAVLFSKKFIIGFESGVIVIKHHRINNNWDSHNCKRTQYLEELTTLHIKENGSYTLNDSKGLPIQSEFSLKPVCKQSLEENRIDKTRIEKKKINKTINTSEETSQTNKDISEVIKMFEVVNPSFEKFYGNTTQRSACERLLKKWSIPQIKTIVNLLPEFNAKEYQKGKSITPLQLEDNLAYIKTFIDSKRQVNSQVIKIS